MNEGESKIVSLPAVRAAEQDQKIIPLTKVKKVSEEKWGREVIKLGFSIIPSLLLRGQQRLGLNPSQLAVLLQVCDFWWEPGRKPFPSKAKISERLGIGERQVQRYLADLEDGGFIKRIERYASNKGRVSNTYDLSGLVRKLQALEPEFRKAEETAKEARAEVRRAGYRSRRLAEDISQSA